jgi:hypothetical protein
MPSDKAKADVMLKTEIGRAKVKADADTKLKQKLKQNLN